MLDEKTLNKFTGEINRAYQQFRVWVDTCKNDKFAKLQTEWNKVIPSHLFRFEEHLQDKRQCKNFFCGVVVPSLQHSWILALARLFDPAYHSRDIEKKNPRLSLDYILELLEDEGLKQSIEGVIDKHRPCIDSIQKQRNNFLAHNDVNFNNTKIEAGVDDLFEVLDGVIVMIKNGKSHLKNCNNIGREYTAKMSKCGVDEIFKLLSKGCGVKWKNFFSLLKLKKF